MEKNWGGTPSATLRTFYISVSPRGVPGISKLGGGGRILRSKVSFDAPSHIPYVLLDI